MKYTVRNTFESFGDDAATTFATRAEAEADAAKMAREMAEVFFPGGEVSYVPRAHRLGLSNEVEFSVQLADDAGATEDEPGKLSLDEIASRILANAIEIQEVCENDDDAIAQVNAELADDKVSIARNGETFVARLQSRPATSKMEDGSEWDGIETIGEFEELEDAITAARGTAEERSR